jgi:hypothetical protein
MSGFKIVEGTPSVKWFPVSCGTAPTSNTVYEGQIVQFATGGVIALGAEDAGPVVSKYPFGIVVGTNNRTPLYNTTYNAQYITSVITQATLAARDFAFVEGMFPKSFPQAMAKVALIDPTCVIEGPIRNGGATTAPGVVTCTTASTDGLTSMVHGAADVALLANNNMYYCRSGADRGFYNMSYAGSQTTPTFYSPWPYDWTVGDTFVAINFGLGRQKIALDSTSQWINNAGALSNYYLVDVVSMDLTKAGEEKAQFRFSRQGS